MLSPDFPCGKGRVFDVREALLLRVFFLNVRIKSFFLFFFTEICR